MSCPDLSALARVGTPHADPVVRAHLRTCDSCWMDWLILWGSRYLDPDINTTASADLNERIIARTIAFKRHSERARPRVRDRTSSTCLTPTF